MKEPVNPCRACGADVGIGNPQAEHCGKCPPWRCEDCGEMDAPPPNSCSCWVPLAGLALADIKSVFAKADLSIEVRK